MTWTVGNDVDGENVKHPARVGIPRRRKVCLCGVGRRFRAHVWGDDGVELTALAP